MHGQIRFLLFFLLLLSFNQMDRDGRGGLRTIITVFVLNVLILYNTYYILSHTRQIANNNNNKYNNSNDN